jgi:hypothetical protein
MDGYGHLFAATATGASRRDIGQYHGSADGATRRERLCRSGSPSKSRYSLDMS